MASVALQIAQAVETRLNLASVDLPSGTVTPPTGLTVFRERIGTIFPDDVKDGPLVNISIGAEPRIERTNWKSPATMRYLELLFGIYVDATDTPAADAIDPAYLWVMRVLQNLPRLGGLSNWMEEISNDSAYAVFQDSSRVVAAREVKVHINFHTRTDDPAVRAN